MLISMLFRLEALTFSIIIYANTIRNALIYHFTIKH